jgi:diguanylate cyclase (GGDEF)-like protein
LGIDDFKSINERFGHEYGDFILKGVADCIVEALNIGEEVYHVVADEFMVVSYLTDDEVDGKELYDRVRRNVDAFIDRNHYQTVFTISGGILSCKKMSGMEYEELLMLSQFALSRAKELGRNQVYFFDEADYEKFENLLDGSLITVTDDLSGLAPRLAGAFTNMYVAASAIFDIGERNMSIVIPEFSGEGTVANGILEIGEKLVVRADMAEPLKFADAELRFAENAVVSADDETALSRERVFGNPYVIAVTDGAFTQTPATDPELAESRWKVELSKDSRSMLMYYVPRGLSVVVR